MECLKKHTLKKKALPTHTHTHRPLKTNIKKNTHTHTHKAKKNTNASTKNMFFHVVPLGDLYSGGALG